MESSLIKIIDTKYERIKYICKIKIIEEELINVNIYLNNELKYKGNILLDKIQIQIKAFLDFNINEIFEEIKQLDNSNFSIIKENNKYILKIKFIILRRKKYLNINLNNNIINDRNEYYEKIIKEKDNKINELNKIINLLEEKLKDKANNNNNKIDKYNNFDISLKKPIYTLNYHKNSIYCLSILNDGRLISGSSDNTIIIYNKTTYQPDLLINEHKYSVWSIIQLSSKILATCSFDKTIKLFNIYGNNYDIIQTLNNHTGCVN